MRTAEFVRIMKILLTNYLFLCYAESIIIRRFSDMKMNERYKEKKHEKF